MVAQVCLGQVGAIAAREIARLARNNTDWAQLIDLCRLLDTLLVDVDIIYDARRANDRLLLGVKGTLSEYELDLLRIRAHEARQEKAARGGPAGCKSGLMGASKVGSSPAPCYRPRSGLRPTAGGRHGHGSAKGAVWNALLPTVLALRSPTYAGAYAIRQNGRIEAYDGHPRRRSSPRRNAGQVDS
jgi:hypothetical protein